MNAMNKENFKNYFDLLDTVLEENNRNLEEVAFRKAARVAASAGKKTKRRPNTRAKGRAADMGHTISLNSTSNSV